MPPPPPTNIVVIGAGVTGLTTALHLLTTLPPGTPLTILAAHFPAPSETLTTATHINGTYYPCLFTPPYTSPWAGAHHRWIPPTPTSPPHLHREHAWSRTTYARMLALAAAAPHAGITALPGIEYLEPLAAQRGGYLSLTPARAAELGIPGFELLPAADLPEGVAWGCRYPTYCVHPMVYCAYLLRRCVLLGARVVRTTVRGWREVVDRMGATVVVNASGDGFGADAKVGVTRGQTVLVGNEVGVTVTRQGDDGSWTFCVPRGFEGGRGELLRRFEGTWEGMGDWRVLGDIVVEVEEGKGLVIHAYGMGGRGYEISWGVAEEVGEEIQGYRQLKVVSNAQQHHVL
ncbi:hypothetical protein B0T18DRAFT_434474 [Schizothecium vesticola]|uniref:FAD dependent oxidoreductase domain-containing protein n=1 Tax=Schizothecium vesticola TaxID=314040 RepID=A0AA40F9V0_9PEZI|nr:hypothetical protein B0T18DRAFT_434474 [Schizothecium vesticola]